MLFFTYSSFIECKIIFALLLFHHGILGMGFWLFFIYFVSSSSRNWLIRLSTELLATENLYNKGSLQKQFIHFHAWIITHSCFTCQTWSKWLRSPKNIYKECSLHIRSTDTAGRWRVHVLDTRTRLDSFHFSLLLLDFW